MREIRTSGSPSGDWKRSGSKSGNAGPPTRQSSTVPSRLVPWRNSLPISCLRRLSGLRAMTDCAGRARRRFVQETLAGLLAPCAHMRPQT